MEREWVAVFDLLSFNSFKQLKYVDFGQWKVKTL